MSRAPDNTGPVPLPFGRYAAVYDLIYRDKDYFAEARFIAGLISRFSLLRDARVLDLACGTGRHAFELATLGHIVEGSDLSTGMIDIARVAAERRHLPVLFHNESFQTAYRIKGKFDAVIAMFGSLGYLTREEDLALAFGNVRKLAVPEGIFIFDVWNGSAVVRDYSPHKVKRVQGGGLDVERISTTTVDEAAKVATVRFDFIVAAQDGSVARFEERHVVRFFFPGEIEEVLGAQGFEVLFRCPFLAADRELTSSDWNMTFVTRCKP